MGTTLPLQVDRFEVPACDLPRVPFEVESEVEGLPASGGDSGQPG